ncbi:MAG TPA: transcriptional regulator [Luteitalea sp.]|nr:transcriptional regulator [Luteitalea sp.]
MRYRFGDFELSPARRVLADGGRVVPLIPRYFDLLVLLIEQRERAVGKQEIFDRVWSDVVVSDSALTQAIRIIRRTLGDDPREPRFVRTVSRHGYQFVFAPVEIAADAGPWRAAPDADTVPEAPTHEVDEVATDAPVGEPAPSERPPTDTYTPLLDVLLRRGPYREATDEQRYDAAVALHDLGTAGALQRLGEQSGHEEARAILRDARWDSAAAGPVPVLDAPGRGRVIRVLLARRARQAMALASTRWAAGALGAAVAGTGAGLLGGLAMRLVPGSEADAHIAFTLALVGALAGFLAGAGIGTGLVAAEAVARSARAVALIAGAAITGLLTGWIAHHGARAVMSGLFGRDIPDMGGPLEGLVLGAATGLGYAIATRRLSQGGMATPRGWSRARVALITGAVAGLGGLALALVGGNLVGASLDLMAGTFAGSQVGLEPFARLLGEGRLRPVTKMVVSGLEAFAFGVGVASGLTLRPRSYRN